MRENQDPEVAQYVRAKQRTKKHRWLYWHGFTPRNWKDQRKDRWRD